MAILIEIPHRNKERSQILNTPHNTSIHNYRHKYRKGHRIRCRKVQSEVMQESIEHMLESFSGCIQKGS